MAKFKKYDYKDFMLVVTPQINVTLEELKLLVSIRTKIFLIIYQT